MQNDRLHRDFLQGHEIWLEQSKQFFEQSMPLLDQFFARPFSDETRALYALEELIYHFKEQIKSQHIFFNFIPPINPALQPKFPKYFSLLSDMTDEVVDMLHEKLKARIQNDNSPQSMREFYEIWLECGEGVYQKWLKTERFLAAFGEIMNGMYS